MDPMDDHSDTDSQDTNCPVFTLEQITESGLTPDAISQTLQVMEKLKVISDKFLWPKIKVNKDPLLINLLRIKQLGKALTSAQKKVRQRVNKVDLQKVKQNDADQLNQTGIRQLRRQKRNIISPHPITPKPSIEIEEEDEQKQESKTSDEHQQKKQKLEHITRKCYVCKAMTSDIHHFYDRMCQPCGDLNYKKRHQTADLTGKVALLTGGRIKIGYEAGLILLRAGASLIVTSRFPEDCLQRYKKERDFNVWMDRLHIYGLDLRFLPLVKAFAQHILHKYTRLDIFIQNAAQTLRRPPLYYRHMIEAELKAQKNDNVQTFSAPTAQLQLADLTQKLLNPAQQLLLTDVTSSTIDASTALQVNDTTSQAIVEHLSTQNLSTNSFSVLASQLAIHPDDMKATTHEFPTDQYDSFHQQVDLRKSNTWILETDQVDTVELMEVNLINYVSPYTLLSELTPIMKATASQFKVPTWVVMVSSMEGQFNRNKTTSHPHTNAAKAALNMIVRTSSIYYGEMGIYMSCVDTGWVTDEFPVGYIRANGGEFHPPLDEIDGAARILDPVFKMINTDVKEIGVFYKDYKPTVW
jgi:NAD(P)-dependent dehydrogenase (short-subunit alcohol dehydrogenase family)